MIQRHAAPEPIEYEELLVPQHFLTVHRLPIDAEVAPAASRPSPSWVRPWLVRVLVMAVWVGLLWLFGWYVTDAKGGLVVAIIGGVALLPYLLMVGWSD